MNKNSSELKQTIWRGALSHASNTWHQGFPALRPRSRTPRFGERDSWSPSSRPLSLRRPTSSVHPLLQLKQEECTSLAKRSLNGQKIVRFKTLELIDAQILEGNQKVEFWFKKKNFGGPDLT
jgi:hypothetical protein